MFAWGIEVKMSVYNHLIETKCNRKKQLGLLEVDTVTKGGLWIEFILIQGLKFAVCTSFAVYQYPH
jgi:hypothetical protein